MKLWYIQTEMRDARIEAESIVSRYNAEIPNYIRGDVKIRMAWRVDVRTREAIPPEEWKQHREAALPAYIPEAELLVNGEVVICDLLDLILIDINRLELKAIQQSRKEVQHEHLIHLRASDDHHGHR